MSNYKIVELESVAEAFKALSDPIRLSIIRLLARQKMRKDICVGDLAKELGTSQPNVSHHLKILKSSGLIRCEKRGGFAFYLLHLERFREISSLLETQLNGD